jgi:hypothetical protein
MRINPENEKQKENEPHITKDLRSITISLIFATLSWLILIKKSQVRSCAE